MIDNIWSGWRSRYVQNLDRPWLERRAIDRVGSTVSRSGEERPSIFSEILASGLDDTETFIVHRGSKVFTIMNSYPYAVGHVLVLPYRQIPELSDLEVDEMAELWSEVECAVRILRLVVHPDGFNIGINLGPAAGGSVSEHLHVHVVPRWFGDANFTVTTAAVKAIPEALDVTAEKVRAAWIIDETVDRRNGDGTEESS